MTASPDLRETVARPAILSEMWRCFREQSSEPGITEQIDDAPTWQRMLIGAFTDAAIAAMQPALERAINAERQRDAALESLKVARDAINKAARQFEFYADNHQRKNTKDGDLKAEVSRNLGGEMRKALARIDAVEGEGR